MLTHLGRKPGLAARYAQRFLDAGVVPVLFAALRAAPTNWFVVDAAHKVMSALLQLQPSGARQYSLLEEAHSCGAAEAAAAAFRACISATCRSTLGGHFVQQRIIALHHSISLLGLLLATERSNAPLSFFLGADAARCVQGCVDVDGGRKPAPQATDTSDDAPAFPVTFLRAIAATMSDRISTAISPDTRVLEGLAWLLLDGGDARAASAGVAFEAFATVNGLWRFAVEEAPTPPLWIDDVTGGWQSSAPSPLAALLARRCREVGMAAALAAAMPRLAEAQATIDAARRDGQQSSPHLPTGAQIPALQSLFKLLASHGVLPSEPATLPLPTPLPPPPAHEKPRTGGTTAGGSRRSGAGGSASAEALKAPQSCHHCGKTPGASESAFQLCGGCRAVRFCSTQCSRAAWKTGHKAECAAAVRRPRGGAAVVAGGKGTSLPSTNNKK